MAAGSIEQDFLKTLQSELTPRELDECLSQFKIEMTDMVEEIIKSILDRTWTKASESCLALQGITAAMNTKKLSALAYDCSLLAKKSEKQPLLGLLPVLFKEVNLVKQECNDFLEETRLT